MSKKKVVAQVESEEIAPVLTMDGVAMHKGMEVFLPKSLHTGAYIERSVVVALSRVNRYFILRCAKGCETKVKLTNGCGYGYGEIPYADPTKARAKIRETKLREAKDKRESAMRTLRDADEIEKNIDSLHIDLI